MNQDEWRKRLDTESGRLVEKYGLIRLAPSRHEESGLRPDPAGKNHPADRNAAKDCRKRVILRDPDTGNSDSAVSDEIQALDDNSSDFIPEILPGAVPCRNNPIDLVAEFQDPIGLRFLEFNEEIEALLEMETDSVTFDGDNKLRLHRGSDRQLAD